MGKFNLGSVRPDQIFIGDEPVEAIYVGSDKVWPIGIKLVATPGEYLISGRPITIGGEFSISMEMGSFTYTGNDLAFVRDRVLKGVAGSYATTGNEAAFGFGKIIQLAAGSFTYTGNDLAFVRDRVLKGVAGSYTISGSVLDAKAQRKISLSAGSYAVTGNAADLVVSAGITLVGTSSATSGATHTLPSGLAENDIVIVTAGRDTGSIAAVPSGWTELIAFDDNFRMKVMLKRMTSTPDTSISWEANANKCSMAFRGVDTTTAIDAALGAGVIASGMPNPPQVTTSTNGCAIVICGGLDDDNVAASVGAPSGFGDLVTDEGADDGTVMMAWGPQTTAGAIDPGAFTGPGDDQNASITIALRKAS